jgi:hypothetical protein
MNAATTVTIELQNNKPILNTIEPEPNTRVEPLEPNISAVSP